MIKKVALGIAVIVTSVFARAELTIEITQGSDNPTSIAIVPFKSPVGLPEDVAAIVSADLQRSGQFDPIPRKNMLALPQSASEVFYRDWRALGGEYLVIGGIENVGGNYQVWYELYDVLNQRQIDRDRATASPKDLRGLAHFVSDKVYEKITGIRGAFSTKIAYVEVQRDKSNPKNATYRLVRADADGAREQSILESKHPLLSPRWSPDGKKIAYVSFETSRPAVFIQDIFSGQRQQMTNFQGLNGAPSWSPDGKQLAFVLSKDGNPEIYTMDIATKRYSRITNHFAIDTEPSWSGDGKSIIFTSNRGGQPQIYQVTLASGRVERLTFYGDYNARSSLSPDGKTMVMVHREDGVFHIAAQNVETGDMRILTETHLDESPSIAPNGAMLLYATQHNGKGILAAVSLDAGVKFRLPSQEGDVREPAWSPFLQ
ncbi:Tol-Pal system beta propeller repeat protein TolB [Marinibactrum halimedae]|uniref:Tol-Pal system beta propeller repeat protein TolB n=1 Tax=Marinibactrum halimedae TaxID=1444977 RepID=UPI001E527624|nr:Tol-Pal system beta propeller repeat protein TolB [Marinibactrum halimedae]MCD9457511.1 Tol-Pal system beta propeller repeat protein TolB [Marinibactrum halimedae]